MKEWKILEWALPHSCWRRTRAWLVGKNYPEASNSCENYSGQFDDVEQAAVGDIEDKKQKKTQTMHGAAIVPQRYLDSRGVLKTGSQVGAELLTAYFAQSTKKTIWTHFD